MEQLSQLHSDIIGEICRSFIGIEDKPEDKLISAYQLLKLARINKKFNNILPKIWSQLWKRDMDENLEGNNKKYILILIKILKRQTKEEQFLRACELGCNKMISYFIRDGIDSKIRNNLAVNKCIQFGHFHTLHYLLSLNPNLSLNNSHFFRLAVAGDYIEIVQFILNKGFNLQIGVNTNLLICSQRNCVKVAKLILENCSNLEINKALTLAIYKKQIKMIRLLVKAGANKMLIPKDKRKEYLTVEKIPTKTCQHQTGKGKLCTRKTKNEFCFQHQE